MPTRDLNDILSPPPKNSLADEVAGRLREAILAGRLEPGERLREEELAQSMQVSRGPIREALSRLEREGLIIKEPNRGAFVARLSREDLDEVYSLRLALERLAVQRAIQKATPGELDELQKIVDMMEAYARQGISEKQAADLDIQFHELLYRAARHGRLYDCWTDLKPQTYILLLGRNVANIDYREMVVDSHQEILEAIRQRDEAAAIAIIEEHISMSYERVVEGYEGRLNGSGAQGN